MVFPILGANTESAAYEIENSLRFNDDDNPNLSRTPSSASNRKTWTWSGWVKRGNISIDIMLLSAGSSGQGVYLTSGNKFNITKSGVGNYGSDALLRDVSAWYHLVVAVDTTQTGMANIAKFYINGTEQSTSGTTLYSTNEDTNINNNVAHYISRWSGSSANNWHDGYLADINFIDGLRLDASYFGETNDNGVWIPKKYTGSYGTNGFFLEFKQTGTSANASGMGADTSGNDNHFTPTNLAAIDVTTDTPTNNFCTMNPLGQGGGGSTIAEGNLKETTDDNAGCPATFAVANGKWYWEIKIEAGSNNHIGIADADFYDQLGPSPNNYRITLYQPDGRVFNMGSTTQTSDSGRVYDQGDIMAIRLDLDSATRTIKWYEDDTLIATENIGAAQVLLTPFAGKGGSSQTQNYNFGNPAFSISSGNSDANGYGNFEYAVPSGHYALCTKNLAEYG